MAPDGVRRDRSTILVLIKDIVRFRIRLAKAMMFKESKSFALTEVF